MTSTTEVPPPTLFEAGDAGYIGEEDNGHEHEGLDWFRVIVFSIIIGLLLVLLGVTARVLWKQTAVDPDVPFGGY